MGIGFLAAWPLPVIGAVVMVLGAVFVAIAAEHTMMVPEFLGVSVALDDVARGEFPAGDAPVGVPAPS